MKMLALIPMDIPSPIGFMNVFEDGDYWEKVQGCEACPTENRKQCCGGCRMWTKDGCIVQLNGDGRQKPYQCTVDPSPDKTVSWCLLEFKCTKGSKTGTIRKVREPIPWLL